VLVVSPSSSKLDIFDRCTSYSGLRSNNKTAIEVNSHHFPEKIFWDNMSMNTTKIFKEEVSNQNIWKLLLIELELPMETDEITFKAVDYDSESKRKESQNEIAD
jgi:hypothetical protein